MERRRGSKKEMLCDSAWVAGEAYFRAIRGELSPSLACRRPEVAGEGVDWIWWKIPIVDCLIVYVDPSTALWNFFRASFIA